MPGIPEQRAGGQVGGSGRRRGERDLRVPGYRLAGGLQVPGFHLQPQQRRRLHAEERLAGIDVEVQQTQFLKLLDPPAHGGLVPVGGGCERCMTGTPVPGQLSEEHLIIGTQGYLLARHPIRRAPARRTGGSPGRSAPGHSAPRGSALQGSAPGHSGPRSSALRGSAPRSSALRGSAPGHSAPRGRSAGQGGVPQGSDLGGRHGAGQPVPFDAAEDAQDGLGGHLGNPAAAG
jgi:hypothetical protein